MMSEPVADASEDKTGQVALALGANHEQVDALTFGNLDEAARGRGGFGEDGSVSDGCIPEWFGPCAREIPPEIAPPGPQRVQRQIADELAVVGEDVGSDDFCVGGLR
jgi:hypothetical protein